MTTPSDKQTDNQPASELLPCPKCNDCWGLQVQEQQPPLLAKTVMCGRCGFRAPFDTWQARVRVVDGGVATVDAERQAAAIVTIWRAVKDHDDKLLVRYIKQALLEWCPAAATAPIAAPVEGESESR